MLYSYMEFSNNFDNFVIDSKLILNIDFTSFFFLFFYLSFFFFFFEMLLNVFYSRIDSAW